MDRCLPRVVKEPAGLVAEQENPARLVAEAEEAARVRVDAEKPTHRFGCARISRVGS
ncbi:MAG: hypothetical protein NZ602_03030 [Thermoguttaceae bacterium]|nr:hypothetical protein [Thermoguttaceae bacterium]MDW8036860.1 hypothetical protein [Thermoguttaceae bacterium]